MKRFMKSSLSLVLAITIIFGSAYAGLSEVDFGGLFAVKAEAASSGTCGDNLTWNLDDEGTLTISGTGDMTTYSSALNVPWYSLRSSVKSVVINSGVISIGSLAFYNCANLTSVTIGNSVMSIGYSAFKYCTRLTSITIPDSVTSIGPEVFYNCKSLKSVTIPDSVTSIGSLAFYYCISLISVTIPDSVTSIGHYAFYGCTSLTSITIPDSITSIGEPAAFPNCTSLTSINVNENNTKYSSVDGVLFNKDKTTLVQYPAGKITSSYTIPGSVTSIGDSAFSGCTNLTSVTIPDSVTSIGGSAFSSCTSLASVTIPDSVTSIGGAAFSSCTSLTSVTIGNSVTSIGSSAFYKCTSLTLLIIPDSVTSIGGSAFSSCTSLASVTIPDSVTSIGGAAFSSCTSLTSVTIGNSVTSIGSYAFYKCTSLTLLIIPHSVTSIGDYAFDSCRSLETVYYGGSEEDWNNISIDSSNTRLKNAKIIFNCKINGVSLGKGEIALTFKVLDSDTLLNNETVNINGTEYDTSKGTVTLFKSDLQETNTITVGSTASEFYEETFKLEYLDDSTETIYLEKKKSDTKPYINYVYYKNTTNDSNWKNAGGEKTTILDTSEEYFEIAVGATAQVGSISKICLAQDGARTLTSTNGIFSNQQLAQVFEPDKDIIAYCIDTNGNVSPAFKTEITIENADENVVSVLNDSKIELFSTSGTSFEISDDVPFLGGTEIGLDFASLPISVSVDGSKYKVAIGLNNKTFTKDEWNLYKKALEEIKDMGLKESSSDSEITNDLQRYKKMQELRKAYGAKAVTGKAVGNGSFDWNILGYVEWEVVNGSPVITDSYIGLSANAGYNWQTPYVVLGVPCYTELGVGVSASVGGSASRIVADSDIPIEWDIKLSIKPSLSLGAGVGCPSFLSLGVEGKGEIEWYQEFLEKYRKINLTLSASVKAKAFLLSFDKEFASKTWNLWSGTYGSDSQIVTYAYPEEYLSSGSLNLLDSDNYNTLAGRDYINQTEWIGGYTPMLFSSRAISVSGYENSLLQTSIYSDSRQQLVEFDGGKMLVWIMDDTTKESANRTELVYSLYNEATATWSEPIAVCDDGTADFLPDVVSDGENVWVTWQNMNTTFTEDTATMANYSAASEIYVAKYNGKIGAFETAIQVTNDTVVDSMPAITVENGNVSVAWVCNSENDYFGLEGVNSINTASISNGVASDTKVVKTNLTSVSSIDCKLTDGELYIAYAYDLDNDYNDMSDMEIYQLKVSDGNITEDRITENSVLDSAPQYSELGNEVALVWYSEGNYNVLSLDSNEVSTVFTENVGATDIYDVAQSAGDITYIIWSQTVGEQVAFYGAVYDGGEWGEPVLLGEATGKALNPSAEVDSDGTMFVVYNSVVQEEVTETVEDTGEEFTYYTDVQTDLALLKVYQNSNITLSDDGLKIEAESVFPSEVVPLTFSVKNNGTTSVDSIDVYIDGELNSTVAVSLLPGQETSVTVDYTVPETVAQTTLSITAEPSDSSDYDSTDNEISVSYGYTELDIDDVTVYSTALKNTIAARICNLSAVDSGAFTVRIRENDENGAIICIESFDNLAVGEALFITQEFDKASMVYDEDGVSKYYVEIVADNSEYLIGNNSGIALFTEENNSGITSELLREALNDGYVHAYGVIQNNEFASHEVYAKIEILDEAGNVIGLKFKKVSLTDKQTYTLDENVHISGEYYETRFTLLDTGTADISLRIPDGITTIDESDFENCSDVVGLLIPDSITSIGENAFSGCDSLVIFCNNNSYAHTYAVDNNIPFIANDDNTTVNLTNNFIHTNYLNKGISDIMVLSQGLTYSINSDVSGTGIMVDVMKDDVLHSQYTLVVYGDTNGDSVCDVLDCAQVERVSNGNGELSGAYAMAADSNSDDEVDITDYQAVVNKALAS